ncbi:MAG TPA: O-antigen ligase family protein [Candidatus Omnitrophota bacterium]|nr:O-antigen ligase family protein [Candidatus Omnitrophota bacterium]
MNKFPEWCERGIRYSFYALAYFLPISISLTEIFSTTIILCYLFLVGREGGRIFSGRQGAPVSSCSHGKDLAPGTSLFPGKMFVVACGIFFAANVISTVMSQHFLESFEALIFKLSEGLILLFAFCRAIKTKKHLKAVCGFLLISATLTSMDALYQSWTGRGFVRGFEIVEQARVTASFKHPNDFGAFLIVASSLVLSFLLAGIFDLLSRRGQRASSPDDFPRGPFLWAWLGLLFFGVLWSLGLTFSRGAWLGFIVATLCLSFYRRKAFWLLLGVCVMFIIIFHPQLYRVRGKNLRVYDPKGVVMQPKDVKTIILPEEESQPSAQSVSVSPQEAGKGGGTGVFKKIMTVFEVIVGKSMGRFNFWKEALLIIQDYPLFGAGLNTYSTVAPRYKINWGGYPHNCYLHMAAETGLVGLASFLWLILVFLQWSWARLKTVRDSFLLSLALGGVTGLSGYLVQCFFDTNLYSVQLNTLFWLVMGMVMASIHVGARDPEPA